MDSLIDLVIAGLWAPETYIKFLFLAVTSPFWWPLAKVMYREMAPAFLATEETRAPRRAPGEDPFLSIPLASHRARQGAASVRGALPGARRRR